MPKCVWMNVGRKATGNRNSFHDPADAPCGEPASAIVHNQRWIVAPQTTEEFLAFRQILSQRDRRGITERNKAFLLPFSANQDGLIAPVDVIQVDSDQFRISNAAAVQQLEDDTIAFGECRLFRHRTVKDRRHLLNAWNAR